jgi:hypothetical protein
MLLILHTASLAVHAVSTSDVSTSKFILIPPRVELPHAHPQTVAKEGIMGISLRAATANGPSSHKRTEASDTLVVPPPPARRCSIPSLSCPGPRAVCRFGGNKTAPSRGFRVYARGLGFFTTSSEDRDPGGRLPTAQTPMRDTSWRRRGRAAAVVRSRTSPSSSSPSSSSSRASPCPWALTPAASAFSQTLRMEREGSKQSKERRGGGGRRRSRGHGWRRGRGRGET